MSKFIQKILVMVLTIIVASSLVGVNVMELSCGLCRESFVELTITPYQHHCPCEGACSCPCSSPDHQHADHDDYFEHTFLQVEDTLPTNLVELVALDPILLNYIIILADLHPKEIETSNIQFITDFWPPPPDETSLCVYRC